MNCFIASAFDHDDIDAVYDKAICPVLAELRIRPLRVDRVEHNDDIDKRIFQLIDQSHLCIADLTHVRPSVYYEAGYAFGTGKPVIYLARSDHFLPRPDDPAGNLKVHFDLQMKNIIPWTEPNETLKKRLRSRLLHVLRPILLKAKDEQAQSKARSRFEALSQNEKLLLLITKSQSLFYSHGFKKGSILHYGPLRGYPYHRHLRKIIKDKFINIHLLAFQGISKTNLEGVSWLWHDAPITDEQALTVGEITSFCLIGSLRSSRHQALAALLPSWKPVGKGVFRKDQLNKHYYTSKNGKRETRDLKHTINMVFIDDVVCENEFTSRVRDVLNQILNV
jgi:nucleoside 2-deoxyribosyltransferase